MNKSCYELVVEACGELTFEENTTAKFLCGSRTPYSEVINIISNARLISNFAKVLKEKFPSLSDDKIRDLLDIYASDLKSNKKPESKILSEIQKSLDVAKSKKDY